MILLALAFVSGVWILQQTSSLPNLFTLYWIGPLFILVFFVWRTNSYAARRTFFLLFALLTGFLWADGRAQMRLADKLPTEMEGQTIEVIGVVATLPQQQERGLRFEFDVEQVLTPGTQVPHHISLSQYSSDYFSGNTASQQTPRPVLHAGERWQLAVRLKRPHGTFNPHGFDFESYALEHNIRATGYLRQDAATKRLDALVWKLGYVIEAAREKIRDRMAAILHDKAYAGVLQALVVGDESEIKQDDWQVFLKTGVNHLISISGLHITMLASLAYGLVYALWRLSPKLVLYLPARKAAVPAGVVVAVVYALLAGFSVPTQRTLYMLSIFAWALWSSKRIAMGRVLAYALFVTVFCDPWAVLAPGFWLSFGAVAIIAFAAGARVGRPHWLREAVSTQWAVSIGLVPLLLILFQQVSLVSPLANAIAIPLVSMAIVPLSIAGGLLPIAWPLYLAHSLMAGLMFLLRWMAELPLSTWQQHAPPVWTLLPALLGVLWLLLPRGMPMRWLGLGGFLPMILVAPALPAVGGMQVSVLDVGQGLAVAIRTSRHVLLYDTGPRYSSQSDSGSRIVIPYLRGEGVARLDGVIVSHDDLDHSGGLRSVANLIPVGWLASALPPSSTEITGLSISPHMHCAAGQKWQWDGVSFEMLQPPMESYEDASIKDNNRSCVLRVQSRYGSLLLAGDIEKSVESRLVSIYGDALRSDVVVAPHHGSNTSSTVEWITAVRPMAVVFTAGYRNRFGHPKPVVVERYRQEGSRILRSDEDGAILFDFSHPEGIGIRRWRQEARHYWNHES